MNTQNDQNGVITSNGSVPLTSDVVVASESPYSGTKSQIPKPPKRKFPILPLLALIAFVFSVISVWRLRPIRIIAEPPARPPSPALMTTSQLNNVAAVGLIEANTENIALSVPVGGWVTAVYAHAGEKVQAGQKLFSLDDRALQAELRTRRAQLIQARAKVATAESDFLDAELLNREAARLSRSAVISREEAQRKQIAQDGARSRLEEAKAAVELAEAQVQQTEVDIERVTVRSPIAGDVLQSDVRVGQYAETGQLEKALMILGNVEPMNARVDIDEQDAWRVREGASATATVRGNSEQRINLTFVRFEPYVLPKKSLTGNSTDRTDTRVLQAIFRIESNRMPLFVGQQIDVFIDQVAMASTSMQ